MCSTRSTKTVRPLQVVATTTCGARRRGFTTGDAQCVRAARADHCVRLDADRDEDLDEWPVGNPLAVRETPPAQDVRGVAHALEEVGDQARLPDARRAEQREETTRAVRDRVLVVAPQALSFALATDERCLRVAR